MKHISFSETAAADTQLQPLDGFSLPGNSGQSCAVPRFHGNMYQA